jgi:uncharacterized protein
MSIDLAKRMVEQVIETAVSDRVEFIWHGGEPLLRGIGFYEEVFDFQKQFISSRLKITNAIQTNLTLLNSQWINFFKKECIQLSTSIDGPSLIHDRNRRARTGNGSHKIILDNLKNAQNSGITVNTLTVVTDESSNYAKEVYEHLSAMGIRNCGFLPCFVLDKDMNVVPPSVKQGAFGNFMRVIFDMYYNDASLPKVREFEEMLHGLFDHNMSVCNYNGSCHRFICVNSNGDVYSCDTSPLSAEYRYGNINTSGLNKVLDSKKRREAILRTNEICSNCKSCQYYKGCRGGCPNHHVAGRYYFCADRKMLYSHIEERLLNLASN